MAQFTNDIAAALKAYGVSKGYSMPDQFYDDMSWGGLTHLNQNTVNPAFTGIITNNATRLRIISRLKAEETGEEFNGVQPSGNNESCNR